MGENYPFDVVAIGPARQRHTVEVVPDPDDPTVWRGALSTATEGEWTIEIRNFESTFDSKCYTPLVIDVTEPGLSPWLLGGLVLALATIGALASVARKKAGSRT